MKDFTVFCADIGSIKGGNFGWASAAANSSEKLIIERDPQLLCSNIVSTINSGYSAALGFECPLFIPIRKDPNCLTLKRYGEGSRAWSASAGAGSLTTGLAQYIWILSEIKKGLNTAVPVFLTGSNF